MKPPRISSLAARLEARRAVSDARHEVHGRASVAVSMLERAHEVRRLDVEILDLERVISKISDTQKAETYRFKLLGLFKLDVVIADKKQLEKLVAVLKAWREALLGSDGAARIELAERLAAELVRGAREAPEAKEPEPSPSLPLLNGSSPVSRWGA
jgi:uncharacterized protein (DUF1015 family)